MKFFRNLKLTKKICSLSVIFLVFLLIMGTVSTQEISKVNQQIKETNESILSPIIELETIKSNVEYIRTKSSSLMGNGTELTETSKASILKDISSHVKTLEGELTKYQNNSNFKTVISNYKKFISAKDTFITFASEEETKRQERSIGEKTKAGGPSEMSTYDSAKNSLVDSLDKIIDKHMDDAKSTYSTSRKLYLVTIAVIVIITMACILITLILSFIIIRETVSPIKKVTDKLKEICENNSDLTQRIGYSSKDEIGELSNYFDLFMDKLHSIIKDVSISSRTISELSENLNNATETSTKSLDIISDTVSSIASNTSDGAAAAEETNASLGETSQFSEATASATRSTLSNSKKTKETAKAGEEKMAEIVTSIKDIASSSNEVSYIITELNKSSEEIGNIIKIITGISAQTNMLALNAAIEAARAGEAGKGFSVVADQIRKLADETNAAAAQIQQLINDNQLKSSSAVKSVEDVENKVSHGTEKAAEVSESIENIIKNVEDIVGQIEDIDNANEQQAKSVKEIEKAISSIAVSSNEVAHGTENISASIQEQLSTMNEIERATEELSEMSKKLANVTSGFKL